MTRTWIHRLLFMTAFLLPELLHAQRAVNIIPQPISISVQEGHFTIENQATIRYSPAHSELKSRC